LASTIVSNGAIISLIRLYQRSAHITFQVDKEWPPALPSAAIAIFEPPDNKPSRTFRARVRSGSSRSSSLAAASNAAIGQLTMFSGVGH
jgi:hypothetical protein